MTSAILSLLVTTTITSVAMASDDEALVQKALVDSYHAYSQGNKVAARKLCADEYMVIEKGEILNFEQDFAFFLPLSTGKVKRSDSLDFKKVKVCGQFAYAVYFLTSIIEKEGKITQRRWYESAVLTKGENGWLISLIHSTEFTTPAATK